MQVLGFVYTEDFDLDMLEDRLVFTRTIRDKKEILYVGEDLFDEKGKVVEVRTLKDADNLITFLTEYQEASIDDLPF